MSSDFIKQFKDIIKKIFAFNQYERDRWVARQAAKIPTGWKVLDAGSGSCPYRNLFSHCDYKTHDFTGLKPEQLSGRAGYGQIDYISDIMHIPVEDAAFDAVLCTEVLEHVPEPILVIKEFARILKPGGRLILSAPLGSGIHQEPYHFYGGFTPYWYHKFLPVNGFNDIIIQTNGGFFKHYGQESIRFAKLTSPSKMGATNAKRMLWIPLWIALSPWFFFVCPLMCYLLDPVDKARDFTIGYNLTATRM